VTRLLALAILVLVAPPALAQVTDDSSFRLQQERSRLDAARENSRIEQDRLKLAPEPPRGLRADPGRDVDRLRRENRLRDRSRQLESDSDRLRGEQQRIERERLFAPPPGQ
jgi:hypothetical protein